MNLFLICFVIFIACYIQFDIANEQPQDPWVGRALPDSSKLPRWGYWILRAGRVLLPSFSPLKRGNLPFYIEWAWHPKLRRVQIFFGFLRGRRYIPGLELWLYVSDGPDSGTRTRPLIGKFDSGRNFNKFRGFYESTPTNELLRVIGKLAENVRISWGKIGYINWALEETVEEPIRQEHCRQHMFDSHQEDGEFSLYEGDQVLLSKARSIISGVYWTFPKPAQEGEKVWDFLTVQLFFEKWRWWFSEGVWIVPDSLFERGVPGIHFEHWQDEQLKEVYGVCNQPDVHPKTQYLVNRSNILIP